MIIFYITFVVLLRNIKSNFKNSLKFKGTKIKAKILYHNLIILPAYWPTLVEPTCINGS